MILTCEQKTILTYQVDMPIFTPFYNLWGQNVYWQTQPFSYNPFTVAASSTSGSPVLIAGEKFFGFLNETGGEFSFDGRTTLTVTLEPGQQLYVEECCNPWQTWLTYNRQIVAEKPHTEAFWNRLEYCTWVEQSRCAAESELTNHTCFCEKFVYDILDRIERLKLPKGKFTIDDGWAINSNAKGQYYTGDWEIDRKKFPHFEQLIKDINAAGYDAGLWFSPFTLSPDCRLAQKFPQLVGTPYNSNNWHNIHYTPENAEILKEYYREVFGEYAAMGIRKLKLDISYGKKDEMIRLLELLHRVIKEIDPSIEIETHIPDIFATKFADTVRLNDVSVYRDGAWRYLTAGHHTVCKYSSPHKILNLDHIGGNNPMVYAKQYLEHFDLLLDYMEENTYPVVSLLPDHFAPSIQEEFKQRIFKYYDREGFRKTSC